MSGHFSILQALNDPKQLKNLSYKVKWRRNSLLNFQKNDIKQEKISVLGKPTHLCFFRMAQIILLIFFASIFWQMFHRGRPKLFFLCLKNIIFFYSQYWKSENNEGKWHNLHTDDTMSYAVSWLTVRRLQKFAFMDK